MLLYDFQKMLYGLLSSNTELKDKIIDISDTIDEDTPLPIILIGEDECRSKGTKIEKGFEITSNIEIWDNSTSFKKIKQLMATIETLLESSSIDIGAYRCINYKCETDVVNDVENKLKKALIQLQIEYLEII